MIWLNFTDQRAEDVLGLIPTFLSAHDPRPARQQIDEGYGHGGGWQKFDGFELDADKGTRLDRIRLRYPGDPPLRVRALAVLGNETLLLFEHDWFVILQLDGRWEAARLD